MANLTSSKAIFLVDFHGQSQHYIFDSSPEELGKLINEHGKYGILKLKQYIPFSGTFKTMTKKEVESWFNWDTYSIEQLRKINYIK